MKSEIIAVGSEMLTPWRQDTNSLYLTEKLNEIGVTVAFKTIVGDRQKDLVGVIRNALGRTDIVFVMGGLGPTEDDLTREAVAEALSLTMRRGCRPGRRHPRPRRLMAHAHAHQQPQAGRRPPGRNCPAQPQRQRSRPVARRHLRRLSQAPRASPRPSQRVQAPFRRRMPAPPPPGPARPPHRQAHPPCRHDSRVPG